MSTNQLPPLPEPDSYQFQHDETGQTMFVDRQQVEWGFEANNPRLHKIGGAFTADQMHAYALAALAQQGKEPVAWRDPTNRNPGQGCTYEKATHQQWPHIFRQPLYTTPPAPQPAPVDERAEFEAWARPNGYDMRRNDVLGHYSSLDTLRSWTGWQARAALQSPAPQTKGHP